MGFVHRANTFCASGVYCIGRVCVDLKRKIRWKINVANSHKSTQNCDHVDAFSQINPNLVAVPPKYFMKCGTWHTNTMHCIALFAISTNHWAKKNWTPNRHIIGMQPKVGIFDVLCSIRANPVQLRIYSGYLSSLSLLLNEPYFDEIPVLLKNENLRVYN